MCLFFCQGTVHLIIQSSKVLKYFYTMNSFKRKTFDHFKQVTLYNN